VDGIEREGVLAQHGIDTVTDVLVVVLAVTDRIEFAWALQ
jgi:hypothetical protein